MHGAANLVIGVEDDVTLIVIAQANWQRKAQLTLLRLIELAALEAPAQKVKFGLCHCAFETEQQTVVEVARIVAAIGVDDERMGECAHNSSRRCQSRFERARRETSSANTAPTCPIETSATSVLKSSRPVICAPD
ncbi:hypothetical protein C265_15272 [Cupriavidus sp. GA3-3]|nr:hypothetical protein C265_15272 [Cupriavidus sp. GA3-3]